MGIYNTYGDCQIKAGNIDGTHYHIGDKCDLDSGAYLTYEGIVLIRFHFVTDIIKNEEIFDKYGSKVSLRLVLDDRNPVVQTMEEEIRKNRG